MLYQVLCVLGLFAATTKPTAKSLSPARGRRSVLGQKRDRFGGGEHPSVFVDSARGRVRLWSRVRPRHSRTRRSARAHLPSLPSPASRPEPATWLPESSASPGVLPVARAVGGQAGGLARVRALTLQSGGHAVSRNVRGPCRRRGCSGLPRAHARLAGTRPRRPHLCPACASGTRAEPELRGSVTAAGADGP